MSANLSNDYVKKISYNNSSKKNNIEINCTRNTLKNGE